MSVHHELSEVRQSHHLTGSNTLTDQLSLLTDLRVLVVDDDPDTRELVVEVLTGCGAEVICVGSAVEALGEIERGHFDVLISDIGMPLMDGYALIERVRLLPEERGGRIPSVALTAYAGVEDRMRARSVGYQMHIPKPVEPAELITIVANLAKRHNMPPALEAIEYHSH
jgi:CheY-like chemotaxis protein